MKSKSILLALVIVFVTAIAGCKKEAAGGTYMNTILISGPNVTTQACAPAFNASWADGIHTGAMVTISNTASTIGLLDSTVVYPVTMKINWVAHTPTCSGDITITSYQRQ